MSGGWAAALWRGWREYVCCSQYESAPGSFTGYGSVTHQCEGVCEYSRTVAIAPRCQLAHTAMLTSWRRDATAVESKIDWPDWSLRQYRSEGPRAHRVT